MNARIAAEVAYRNDTHLKTGLVREMGQHTAADRLLQGTYLSVNGENWRGSGLGLTVAVRLAAEYGKSFGEIERSGQNWQLDWHDEWSRVTGLPVWLGIVDDVIFDGLSAGEAHTWPLRLLEVVPVGADLDPALAAWLRDIIMDSDRGAVASATRAVAARGRDDLAATFRAIRHDATFTEIREVSWAAAHAFAGGVFGDVDTCVSAAVNSADSAVVGAADAVKVHATHTQGFAGYDAVHAGAAGAARDAAAAYAAAAVDASCGDRAKAAAIERTTFAWIAERLLHHLAAAPVPGPGALKR